MNYQLGFLDTAILVVYGIVMVGMGAYFLRKTKTSEEFMVAGRGIPAWAAGIAVMSAYTSSISYIAVPGKAFDSNWHPLIFALTAIPVTWFVTQYVIPHYRKNKIISVYKYLEDRIGEWARVYASFSFVLFMVGRTAVILYLSSLLLTSFIDVDIHTLIIIIGVMTIAYTLMGGMEAVIWTDVMQSIIMIGGLLFSAYILTTDVFSQPDYLIQKAFDANKFSLGDTSFSLSSRTIWVMIDQELEVRFDISNSISKTKQGILNFEIIDPSNGRVMLSHDKTLKKEETSKTLSVKIPLQHKLQMWDEFNPQLYKLGIKGVVNKEQLDSVSITFGLRKVITENNRLIINGRKTFLRGEHDAGVSPLTGYPTMVKEDWLRIFKIGRSI